MDSLLPFDSLEIRWVFFAPLLRRGDLKMRFKTKHAKKTRWVGAFWFLDGKWALYMDVGVGVRFLF
jgi:hypothetical protein